MYDVAKLAGVSVKTVSNVVNGYPYIRETTRARVMDAIEQLDYRLNVTARNLRSGRTAMIALAVPELRLPYFAELADVVIRAAEAVDLDVLIEQTNADRKREVELLSGRRKHLTDGVIFSPLALGQADRDLFDVEFPLVLLGERIFASRCDHVTMRNVEGAKAATMHLAGLGRRRIALIGAHEGEVMGTAKLRLDGYLEGLAESGLAADPALVIHQGPWNRVGGAEAMGRLLDSGTPVDAVFALNDSLAMGVLHVLHERRIAVPDDIAVFGFDNTEDARFSIPTLSSVDPGKDEIAGIAIKLLTEQLGSAGGDREPVEILTDFTLALRDSTGG